MSRRGSLISRMLIGFAVFAVLIAVAATVGFVAVAQQNSTAKQLTGRYYVLQPTAGHMQEEFNISQVAISAYALSGDKAYLVPIRGQGAAFARDAAALRALAPRRLQGYVRAQSTAGAQLFAAIAAITRLPPRSPAAQALASRTALTERTFFAANKGMQDYMAADVQRLTRESTHALSDGLVWSAAALGVAVLLVLVGSLFTLGTITRPLRALTAVVGRRTSGDYGARAPVFGSAEVREVAQAVNREADEGDRLRAQEAETNRLRAVARAAGIRIREPLTASAVVAEARVVLEENVDADAVFLQLVTDRQVGPPLGHAGDWAVADAFRDPLPEREVARLREMFRAQTSEVVDDLESDQGEAGMPEWIRDALLAAGVRSHLLTPFGAGDEMLGFLVADRFGQSRPWSLAEVDAVESIAADIGRGLHHARLYESENRLVEHLRSLDAAKSDFFATVAHELRAPLTSIEGYVEMLADEDAGPVTTQQRRMLVAVDRGASRLRNLIDDVFTLAKLESGAFEPVMRPVNLAEVISGAAEALGPEADAAGLTLRSESPGEGLMVDGDVSQLDRVMANLLSNAVKFTPAGGSVDVTGQAEPDWAVIRVSDTGIGVPDKDQAKLFTRFFRASNAVERSISGTGLGLAIVASIVESHGGDVRFDSREGVGTSVTVRLPLPAPAAAGGG